MDRRGTERLLYTYMEIHVHSTLAMAEVGRKER